MRFNLKMNADSYAAVYPTSWSSTVALMMNKLTKLMFSLRISVVTCLVVAAGCGTIIPGTPWKEQDAIGPGLLDTDRARVVERCAALPQFMSNGPCELGFVDQHGTIVEWLRIQADIDRFIHENHILTEDRTGGRYKLYLLTISPLVIMAVPIVKGEWIYCSAPLREGCIISAAGYGGYFYSTRVPVRGGTFWFSPDLGARRSEISGESTELKLADSILHLKTQDGFWEVSRVPLNVNAISNLRFDAAANGAGQPSR